jgi:D-lactate dehydrogenase
MKTIFFDWHDFEQAVVEKFGIDIPDDITFSENNYSLEEALGFEAVAFWPESKMEANDLNQLKENGLKKIFARSAGFNNIPFEEAKDMGIRVYRVAAYSPESIAEHTIALMLNLARKLNQQRNLHIQGSNGRTTENMGFLLHGKTLGIYGYGHIGQAVAQIARNGFGMKIKFYDPFVNEHTNDEPVENLEQLFSESDVVTVHSVLNDETRNSVNKNLFANVKDPFMLINAARGGILKSEDIIDLLDDGTISFLGVDVWGDDDKFDERLLRDNVIQTDHVAFFTEEAVKAIINQTLESWSGNPLEENIV